MKKYLFVAFILFFYCISVAQVTIDHVEPPNWWVGMKNNTVQLMIHGNNIGRTDPLVNMKGVKIKKSQKAGADYLFLDLQLARDLKPCSIQLSFNDDRKPLATWNYELKAREIGSAQRKSFTTAELSSIPTIQTKLCTQSSSLADQATILYSPATIF